MTYWQFDDLKNILQGSKKAILLFYGLTKAAANFPTKYFRYTLFSKTKSSN